MCLSGQINIFSFFLYISLPDNQSNIFNLTKHRHHYHFSENTSTPGHRPPPTVAPVTGSVLLESTGISAQNFDTLISYVSKIKFPIIFSNTEPLFMKLIPPTNPHKAGGKLGYNRFLIKLSHAQVAGNPLIYNGSRRCIGDYVVGRVLSVHRKT